MKQDIIDAIEYKELNLSEMGDFYDLKGELDYDGTLHEIIDGNIDIYYYSLRQWSVDNYNYIEEAIEEGLCEGVTDFHKFIQCGQYLYYRDLADELCEEIFKELTEAKETAV